MIKYNYNNIILPALPNVNRTTYPYCMIYKGSKDEYGFQGYNLIFYTMSQIGIFEATQNNKKSLYLCNNQNFLLYQTYTRSAAWYSLGGSTITGGHTFVCSTDSFVWCEKQPICNVDAILGGTGNEVPIIYEQTASTEIIAADEPKGSYNVDTTIQQGSQKLFTILATTSDSGTLSYQWYINSVIIPNWNYPYYILPSDELGTYKICCWLINSLNNTQTAIWTGEQIITVVPKKRQVYSSYILGQLMAKEIFNQREKATIIKIEPIAYLFNEVRYPAIPEYDNIEYPYACIITGHPQDTYNTYRVSNKPLIYKSTDSSGNDIYGFDNDAKYIDIRVRVNQYHVIGESWSNWIEYTGSGEIQTSSSDFSIFWINHELYNKNGVLILKPTTPIPIYE